MEYNEQAGSVVNNAKSIEYIMNCIITNFISPQMDGVFKNVILNSGVMNIGAKIKVIKTICYLNKEKFNFDKLHRLFNIRNIFAHEDCYMDYSEKNDDDIVIKIDNLKSDGTYDTKLLNERYYGFMKLYEEVYNEITKLNEILTKKDNRFK